ncbi:MAG: ABC transporter ATP-binding protein [Candidatus Thermoplasmatota archaeon]|nr:ABC transporter ATP-binding protein [Candidatus Thermoplasmatota archaeon]MBS3790837.1 ABC transporter ATP-binding protein [Candidatus Thermoplasmatota archaeon]
MNEDCVIRTENLVKKFGDDVTAVDNVSFEIERGEVVGYLGPNGAGKTTTIKILTNLIEPTSGTACINGIDINRYPKKALKNVGSLIGVPGVYGYMTPDEVLTYFGKVYRMSKEKREERIEEVLDLVNLSDWRYSKIESFSTGMERRLAIGKSIFHEPSILILDEPVLGLDPEGIREMRELIKSFQEKDVTVFLSSHLLDEVSKVCDSVIFLYDGKMIERDSVERIDQVMKQYRLIEVEFLDDLSESEIQRVQKIPVIDEVTKINNNKIRIMKKEGDPASTAEILRKVIEEDFDVISYSPKKSDLEDFYVSLVRGKGGAR